MGQSYDDALRRQRQLLDLMLTGEARITDEDIERFLRSPNLRIPTTCVEARRVPWGMVVHKVYLDDPPAGEIEPVLALHGLLCEDDRVRQVIRRAGLPDFFLSNQSYEIFGFVDHEPVYMVNSAYYHGMGLIDHKDRETLKARSLRGFVNQVIVEPVERGKGENFKGYRYSISEFDDVIAVRARHEQIRYVSVGIRGWHLEVPFRHVTPPFKSKDGPWRYWGTTGTHVCLMEFVSWKR